ncbi:ATP-binding protein [Bifidobacterium sp. ESL0800]|uniref:ATP-binding protein n=1 Tax=Bifidobacterium sp. ESL0800 TaxID=2983236 RepID=UPI0023F905E6|nr:ATP-binding protein [Bifidobacterium sp. ESL0800]WEV75377.1 ATP-binding protein [Bifidobacterium sp. ESL0800]
MIPREITAEMHDLFRQFPIVSLTGARQTGKTTLLREVFSDYAYVSLENPRMRELLQTDADTFFARYGIHVIFDEAQRMPDLFSYLQGIVDERHQEPGQFILSGSQSFLLMKSITQSLAGRVAVLHLMPFSRGELKAAGKDLGTMDEWMWRGGYPRLYDTANEVNPEKYFRSYIDTYLERDVREELGVRKLSAFRNFLVQCAIRVGELINYASLAKACGIDVKTVQDWLSVLEASFIVYRMYPYYKNYGKRLVKTPKLYFYDTGLVAYLLGIISPDRLLLSKYRGPIFENAVSNEVMKEYYVRGRKPTFYFWRDTNQKEVDLVIEKGGEVQYLVEVKASATYDLHAFARVDELGETMGLTTDRRIVVYGGDQAFDTRFGRLLTLDDVDQLVV